MLAYKVNGDSDRVKVVTGCDAAVTYADERQYASNVSDALRAAIAR